MNNKNSLPTINKCLGTSIRQIRLALDLNRQTFAIQMGINALDLLELEHGFYYPNKTEHLIATIESRLFILDGRNMSGTATCQNY